MSAAPAVDVVVVAYNSRTQLRDCLMPLVSAPDVHVIVVDNASPDQSLEVVRDLPVTAIQLARNGGFATGVNAGWRAGSAPYVLLLNPDARIDVASLRSLTRVLDEESRAGAVAPRIDHADGSLDFSQRRYPRLRSTYAQALFLHRVFPRATWTDELVRDEDAYARRGTPDWVSGACILVRREALVALEGLDEGFFMYAEDVDLCRRLRSAGYGIVFEPAAVVEHVGGASAPRAGPVADARGQPGPLREEAPRTARRVPRARRSRARGGDACARRARRTAARAGHARALLTVAKPVATSHPARAEPPL